MANAPPYPTGPPLPGANQLYPDIPPNLPPPPSYNVSAAGPVQPKLACPVEIRVSCKGLKNKDVMSKSDPMAVLFQEERNSKGEKTWKEVARTEVIQDTLNPEFVSPLPIEYRFEEHQKLKFEIYDSDSSSQRLLAHDFLGVFETTLGSLVGECGGHCTKNLKSGQDTSNCGTISVNVEEVTVNKEILSLRLSGKNLDKKDFFGKSDPFFVISRCAIEDNSFMAVHKSEVIMNNLNPSWKDMSISAKTLCNGDPNRAIRVDCYDWDSDGSHDFIGSFATSLHEIKSKGSETFSLINPKKKQKKKNYVNSGMIQIVLLETHVEASFLDYIHGGTELCFHVAIDFTASNGNPSDSRSLHYRSPNGPNMYAQALFAVGSILADYDRDKIIPAFGFGARINGTVYHDFHLNQQYDPNCFGLQAVIDAYYHSLAVAELYGPTNFAPIISKVSAEAGSVLNGSKYHILLILTDGVISDMEYTKRAIVKASKLPLSIIIVGVGNADFEAMDELDSDNVKLKAGGMVAERDIVQFVPFRNFLNTVDSGARLAKEVLYEVPNQLTSFMKHLKLKPGNM